MLGWVDGWMDGWMDGWELRRLEKNQILDCLRMINHGTVACHRIRVMLVGACCCCRRRRRLLVVVAPTHTPTWVGVGAVVGARGWYSLVGVSHPMVDE
jgi:hypothetical protein